MCVDAEMAENPGGGPKCVGYWQCHKLHGPQFFKYKSETMVSELMILLKLIFIQQLFNPSSHSCLTTRPNDACLHLTQCAYENVPAEQQWYFTGGVDKKAHARVMSKLTEPGPQPPELDYIENVLKL